MMKEEQRLDLLKDEYIQLQSFYEDIDKRALTIKGWNITISLASIGAGFLISPYLWPIAALAAIMFWYLEAFWRNYHYFLSVRITEIENALNNDTWINLVPLQLYTTWSKAFKKVGSRTSKYFFKPVTLFPHLFIILLCIGLYILWNFGIIQVPIKLNPNN